MHTTLTISMSPLYSGTFTGWPRPPAPVRRAEGSQSVVAAAVREQTSVFSQTSGYDQPASQVLQNKV